MLIFYIFGYNPRDGQKDELISPVINLSGDSIELDFSVSYQKYTNSSKQDTLQIFISSDCGSSFENMIFEKGGDDLNSFDVQTENFIPFEENHWRQENIILNDYTGQEILLKFITTNYRGNNIVIDNIKIHNESGLNISSFLMNHTNIYPNPTNGKINIKFNNKLIDNFILTNAIGQVIMEKEITESEIFIDLSKQPKGIYFINFTGNKILEKKQIILL